ncbi:MAG: glycosyltransferase, partial [bacterium]|nr:glycosyltransferase [bacterium]
NRLRVLVAGFVLRRASRIRVVSERIKTSLEKKYHLRAPVTVLPSFVDVELFRDAKVEENLAKRFAEFKTKLLVVSRLEPEKNVGLAIRAFAKSAIEDSCLIILGEGREKESLQKLSEKVGLSKWVFFEGAEAPIKYYKLADLVLAPSLYEGYGMVIVEALASGVPVLSTDVGIAREAGAIIAGKDSFAEAIKTWFESGSRVGELRNYPYKNFEEYVEAYCGDIKSCTR